MNTKSQKKQTMQVPVANNVNCFDTRQLGKLNHSLTHTTVGAVLHNNITC